MILSDGTLRNLIDQNHIVIDPYDPGSVQPASVDLHLHSDLLLFEKDEIDYIDPYYEQPMVAHEAKKHSGFLLQPQEFALGSTIEAVGVPNGLVGRLEGKSSLARLGLLVHITAGFIDPGWKPAQITLELVNLAPRPIALREGMKIAQISFYSADQLSDKPYGHADLGSKYQGQAGPTASKYHLNK